jgi:group I intron endonuclease
MPILYAIKHVPSGRAYIGSTVNPKERHATHLRMLKKGKHHCHYLQKAWDKYGEFEFEFKQIGMAETELEIREMEQAFLDAFFGESLFNAKCSAIGMPSGDSHPSKRADWYLKIQMPLMTKEQRNIRFGGNRGKKRNSPEYSIAVTKQWADPQQKIKRSIAMRGPRKIVECPHCHIKGGGGNMRRYHFDRCKNARI